MQYRVQFLDGLDNILREMQSGRQERRDRVPARG